MCVCFGFGLLAVNTIINLLLYHIVWKQHIPHTPEEDLGYDIHPLDGLVLQQCYVTVLVTCVSLASLFLNLKTAEFMPNS